jgi:hypothetical protein
MLIAAFRSALISKPHPVQANDDWVDLLFGSTQPHREHRW